MTISPVPVSRPSQAPALLPSPSRFDPRSGGLLDGQAGSALTGGRGGRRAQSPTALRTGTVDRQHAPRRGLPPHLGK